MKKFLNDFFLSWYALGWAALTILTVIVLRANSSINSIKAVGFEVAFENRARNLGVLNSAGFESIKNLNEEELKYFLIMGGREANFYRFTNTALRNNASKFMYKNLSTDSLLIMTEVNDSTTMISQTETGKKLHRALVQSLYSQLINISANRDK
jgi:hypothetical protein